MGRTPEDRNEPHRDPAAPPAHRSTGQPLPRRRDLSRPARPQLARRRAVLGGTGLALLALGLGAPFLVGGTPFGPDRASPQPGPTPTRTSAGAGSVRVEDGAYAGRPLADVRADLVSLGLVPVDNWVNGTGRARGTVVQVRPAGRVPAGSTVYVWVAAS